MSADDFHVSVEQFKKIKNNHIVCITGMSASGKDSVAQVLSKQLGYKFVVSATTRPKRSEEVDGVHYYFKTPKEFQELIDNKQLIEYRYYDALQNGILTRWHYGIEKKEIDLNNNSYVTVVDLKGLEDLKKVFGGKVLSFYLDVEYEDRKLRAIARDKNYSEDEFERRYKDDLIKFEDVEDKVDYIVFNDEFKECLDYIKAVLSDYK